MRPLCQTHSLACALLALLYDKTNLTLLSQHHTVLVDCQVRRRKLVESCHLNQWSLVEVTECPVFPEEHVLVTVKMFLSHSEERLFMGLCGGLAEPAACPDKRQWEV